MIETYKNGKHSGYEIEGHPIKIHSHINDPGSWFVTIRPVQVFAEYLCSKNCTKEEIARHINVLLTKQINNLNKVRKAIIPFT